jgi:hypothetical protein
MNKPVTKFRIFVNSLNAELNPICHLLVLLEAHPVPHVSRVRVQVRLKCLALYVNKKKVLMLAAKLKITNKALQRSDMVSGCEVI